MLVQSTCILCLFLVPSVSIAFSSSCLRVAPPLSSSLSPLPSDSCPVSSPCLILFVTFTVKCFVMSYLHRTHIKLFFSCVPTARGLSFFSFLEGPQGGRVLHCKVKGHSVDYNSSIKSTRGTVCSCVCVCVNAVDPSVQSFLLAMTWREIM